MENKEQNKNTEQPPILSSEELEREDMQGVDDTTAGDLRYNEEEDSFELNPVTEADEYDHPLPYDTAAPQGEDDNSTYDEENPYTQNEYQDTRAEVEADLDLLGTEAADESVQLDELDEQFAEGADEDTEEGVDEEGYPLRDDADGEDNPITDDPTQRT